MRHIRKALSAPRTTLQSYINYNTWYKIDVTSSPHASETRQNYSTPANALIPPTNTRPLLIKRERRSGSASGTIAMTTPVKVIITPV